MEGQAQALESTAASASPSLMPSIRSKKRKLEDAIQSLDVAVSPSHSSTELPLSKRPHLSRSLYSTLAKYGIKSREDPKPSESVTTNIIDISTRAPHLAAILARRSSQKNKGVPFKHPSTPPVHSSSEYRPSSTQSFLSRLATYKLSTYANKPPQIDAVAAAKCGWINDGKDRLVCGMCGVSWVLAAREGMTREAANALIGKQRISLVEMHKDGCPWKTRQCDASIYRVLLQSPSAMVHDLRSTAIFLEPVVDNVAIKHPLSSSHLNSLRSAVSTTRSPSPAPEDPSAMQVDDSPPSRTPEVSDTSLIVALFGWVLAPSPPPHERRRTTSLSASYAGTSRPFASMPPTPSLSRASSVSRSFIGREGTPTPAAGPSVSTRIGPSISQGQLSASPLRPRVSFCTSVTNSISSAGSAKIVERDMSLIYCPLCQRRVGLWSFATVQEDREMVSAPPNGDSVSTFASAAMATATATGQPRKPFDLLKEHRSYCPYVVCSTVVPSASAPNATGSPGSSGNLVEGWRAVLAVIQRHGLSQRQRLAHFMPNGQGSTGTRDEELEGVEALVAGVKSKGGRDLLKYVKSLLG